MSAWIRSSGIFIWKVNAKDRWSRKYGLVFLLGGCLQQKSSVCCLPVWELPICNRGGLMGLRPNGSCPVSIWVQSMPFYHTAFIQKLSETKGNIYPCGCTEGSNIIRHAHRSLCTAACSLCQIGVFLLQFQVVAICEGRPFHIQNVCVASTLVIISLPSWSTQVLISCSIAIQYKNNPSVTVTLDYLRLHGPLHCIACILLLFQNANTSHVAVPLKRTESSVSYIAKTLNGLYCIMLLDSPAS